MIKIIDTTDGKFIGKVIDETIKEIQLNDSIFIPDFIKQISSTEFILYNNNYVIYGEVQ
jgi:hypothetical protein